MFLKKEPHCYKKEVFLMYNLQYKYLKCVSIGFVECIGNQVYIVSGLLSYISGLFFTLAADD
jgi:hypothetical protein